MKKNSFRILKLKSGEELITRIAGEKNGNLIIERPMKFHSSLMTDGYGRTKEFTILKNWLIYSSYEKTTIPKDFIASFLKPDNDVLQLYELEKKKDDSMKNQKNNRIIKKDSRNPYIPKNNRPNNFKDAEEVQKMMDMLHKAPIDEEMMDRVMNEINNLSDEELDELRKDSERNNEMDDDFENYITMSLYLPPEALLTLIDSGLVEEDQIKSIIDSLSQGKTSSEDEFPFGNFPKELFGGAFPPIGYKKFKDEDPNGRDSDEYGLHWKDWSPYPDDYLDDRP